jgi:hypothetical protein
MVREADVAPEVAPFIGAAFLTGVATIDAAS